METSVDRLVSTTQRVFVSAAVVVCLLSGCTAKMVSRPGSISASQYAPVNEGARSGVIKYLNQGAESIVKKRRADAYRQMYEACGGTYRIDAEGPRAEGGAAVPIGEAAVIATTEYWYIQFSCVKEASPPDVVYLKDGTVIKGRIVLHQPKYQTKIRTADGEVLTFTTDQIVLVDFSQQGETIIYER